MDTPIYDIYLGLVQPALVSPDYVERIVTRDEDPSIPDGYEKRPVVWPTTGERFMGLYPAPPGTAH